MECTTAKSKIEATAGEVREASYKEKAHNLSHDEIVNQFLDRLWDFKVAIRTKISEIEGFIVRLEELTWFDFSSLDEESLKQLNDVISGTKDWTGSLNRNYATCVKVLDGKLVVSDLDELKESIMDLDEAADDLEKAVFIFPNDEEFKVISQQLSEL
jgi:hypothetical protein